MRQLLLAHIDTLLHDERIPRWGIIQAEDQAPCPLIVAAVGQSKEKQGELQTFNCGFAGWLPEALLALGPW